MLSQYGRFNTVVGFGVELHVLLRVSLSVLLDDGVSNTTLLVVKGMDDQT